MRARGREVVLDPGRCLVVLFSRVARLDQFVEELDGGFSFVLDRSPEVCSSIANLAWKASRCCSWATFEVELPPGEETIPWTARSERETVRRSSPPRCGPNSGRSTCLGSVAFGRQPTGRPGIAGRGISAASVPVPPSSIRPTGTIMWNERGNTHAPYFISVVADGAEYGPTSFGPSSRSRPVRFHFHSFRAVSPTAVPRVINPPSPPASDASLTPAFSLSLRCRPTIKRNWTKTNRWRHHCFAPRRTISHHRRTAPATSASSRSTTLARSVPPRGPVQNRFAADSSS